LDPLPLLVDAASLAALVIALMVGSKALKAFRESKQAVTESSSLLDLIVAGLSSRVDRSESIVHEMRAEMEAFRGRSEAMESEQKSLGSRYLQLLHYLQELMANDKRMILELERVKVGLTALQRVPPAPSRPVPVSLGQRQAPPSTDEEILSSLTPTERRTLDILSREGAKAAPELGRRLKKSREHTARLMKKLYLEGYVDRESNRAPFRYRINEKVRVTLGTSEEKALTPQA